MAIILVEVICDVMKTKTVAEVIFEVQCGVNLVGLR